MTYFIKANRISVEEYLVPYNGNIIVEKYILKPKEDFKRQDGYLHLLEHMLIKENREWFTKLENGNIYFNAVTSKETIEFIFFHFKKNIQINFLEQLNTIFSIENLELERKTILQEKVWLDNTMQDSTEIKTIIGSENDIYSFDLINLNNLKKNLDKVTKITFSNDKKGFLLNKKYICVEDFQKSLVAIEKSNNYTMNENDLVGKLVIYFFNIVEKVMNDAFEFEVEKKKDCFKIITDRRIEKLNKKQVFSRYLILLNNFNFFEKEITFIIETFSAEIENIEELFINTTWELIAEYE